MLPLPVSPLRPLPEIQIDCLETSSLLSVQAPKLSGIIAAAKPQAASPPLRLPQTPSDCLQASMLLSLSGFDYVLHIDWPMAYGPITLDESCGIYGRHWIPRERDLHLIPTTMQCLNFCISVWQSTEEAHRSSAPNMLLPTCHFEPSLQTLRWHQTGGINVCGKCMPGLLLCRLSSCQLPLHIANLLLLLSPQETIPGGWLGTLTLKSPWAPKGRRGEGGNAGRLFPVFGCI